MKKTLKYTLLLILSISSAFSADYTIQTIPNVQVEDKTQWVSNPDEVLNTETVSQLNLIQRNIHQITTAEVVVVAVRSIGQEDIKQFATELFKHWGIGKHEKDNGLLILFVENQRKITFETGYGMEGILPDAICKRIQIQDMIPYFREGNYDQGLIAGIKKIELVLTDPTAKAELEASVTPPVSLKKKLSQFLWWYFGISIALFILLLLPIISTLKKYKTESNYAQYCNLIQYQGILTTLSILSPLIILWLYLWYKGKLKGLRNNPVTCPTCQEKMHKLSEEEEDPYLNTEQQAEEKLQSVDYDVWVCRCGNREIYPYESQYTKFQSCPQCQAKTYSFDHDGIVTPSTPFSTGLGERTYSCKHCGWKKRQTYIIPMIIIATSNRRGGGFGGGGFSGGGFGGGGSGGGGSTSGW